MENFVHPDTQVTDNTGDIGYTLLYLGEIQIPWYESDCMGERIQPALNLQSAIKTQRQAGDLQTRVCVPLSL